MIKPHTAGFKPFIPWNLHVGVTLLALFLFNGENKIHGKEKSLLEQNQNLQSYIFQNCASL